MRTIPGTGMLLLGSGLYWILSSQLIASFSALTPGLFQGIPLGQELITTIGVLSAAAGLWTIQGDLDLFRRLSSSVNGYVYALPISLAAVDIYSTLVSLSSNSQSMELNPFVASAIQFGSIALVPFLVSYLALSEGLGLLMIATGKSLFGKSSPVKSLPFAIICGIASFGPFSNIIGMSLGFGSILSFALGSTGSLLLSAIVFRSLKRMTE